MKPVTSVKKSTGVHHDLGRPEQATLFYLLYLYRNAFEYFRMGYASALAWVLFIYILVLTLVLQGTSRYWVYYEGEDHKG